MTTSRAISSRKIVRFMWVEKRREKDITILPFVNTFRAGIDRPFGQRDWKRFPNMFGRNVRIKFREL